MDVFADLRSVGCDIITLGQYLQPTPDHLPVDRYVPPEEFDEIGDLCRSLGFRMVASGPFVRSSYHAREMAEDQAPPGRYDPKNRISPSSPGDSPAEVI
ncbi:MAG: hypothetical protein O2931_14005, partial [Planctomycetota bacterium]|nr:hypothetical protein [Planctomycetota bacterium]